MDTNLIRTRVMMKFKLKFVYYEIDTRHGKKW